MAKYKVAERFVSINGESVKAGELVQCLSGLPDAI